MGLYRAVVRELGIWLLLMLDKRPLLRLYVGVGAY